MPAPTRTTPKTRIRTKSVYQPAEPADGRRVLVTRYWPRGVPRTATDEYVPSLAPSRDTLHDFKAGRLTWAAFRERYLAQMGAPDARQEIRRLARLAAPHSLTLMCVCKTESRCHRSLLRELIEQE